MLACNKRPYPTAVSAALVLRRLKAANPGRGEVGIHPCPACHAFHLTSSKQAARNRWTVAALRQLQARI